MLGFEIASRPAHYHEILIYLKAVAAASNRVRLREYGRTAGGRALLEIIISSPANLAHLEARQRLLARVDEAVSGAMPENLPAAVWIGCGIHGDEISGPDAALALLHTLASSTDSAMLALLDRLVIHLDPMVNPDGRERFLAHVSAFGRVGAAVDPQDLLHNPFWPEGRGNHYLFDLNRDAIFSVQAESRARIAAITQARPQAFIDMHEMAAADTYLFAVPAEPLNPHLPSPVHDSWRDIARDHAAAFDRAGTSYYTRSWNEVFYPGFFDIWPAYHGAVPVLYEQSATSGSAVRLPNGKLRTYREAVDNQLCSVFANLATVAGASGQFLERWARARNASRDAGSAERHWFILPDNEYKSGNLLRLLLAQGVSVERLGGPADASGLYSMWQDSPLSLRLPAGTLHVSTRQPLGALIRNIFDFHVPVPQDFCERERRGLDLGGKTLLFDVTAWSVPMAYGADVYWSNEAAPGDWQVEAATEVRRRRVAGGARYGFICADPSLHAGARLAALGVKVRVAREPFTLGEERFEAGTLLMRREDQPDGVRLDALVEAESDRTARFAGVDSARILEGPDLGGREFELLPAPSVAVLTGAFLNAPSSGAIWHLLDSAIGMPLTLLDFARLGAFDLAHYNVLVVGDCGDAEAFNSLLKSGHLERLQHWVHGGGTLIAMSGGAFALAGCGLTATRPRSQLLERHPPLALGRPVARMLDEDFVAGAGAAEPAASNRSEGHVTAPVIGAAARAFCAAAAPCFEFPERAAPLTESLDGASVDALPVVGARLRAYLPRGAYLRADLKPQHWLRFGVPDRLPVLFRENDALVAGGGADLVGRFAVARDLALAGLVWPEAVGYVAGSAMLVCERMGRGQVVLFANDALFRGYSLGSERLFLNALLYGPALRVG